MKNSILHIHAHLEGIWKTCFVNPVLNHVKILLLHKFVRQIVHVAQCLDCILKLNRDFLMFHNIAHVIIKWFFMSVAIKSSNIKIIFQQIKSDDKPFLIEPKVWLFGLGAKTRLLKPKPFLRKWIVLVELTQDFGLPIRGVNKEFRIQVLL